MNANNFRRLITCLESDWAQSRPTYALKLLWAMADKDGGDGSSVCHWLDITPQQNLEIFRILESQHLDERDKFAGKAAALREWCHANGVQIGEVAA